MDELDSLLGEDGQVNLDDIDGFLADGGGNNDLDDLEAALGLGGQPAANLDDLDNLLGEDQPPSTGADDDLDSLLDGGPADLAGLDDILGGTDDDLDQLIAGTDPGALNKVTEGLSPAPPAKAAAPKV